eukprot:3763415-Rhodomonas_salina.1
MIITFESPADARCLSANAPYPEGSKRRRERGKQEKRKRATSGEGYTGTRKGRGVACSRKAGREVRASVPETSPGKGAREQATGTARNMNLKLRLRGSDLRCRPR